MAVIEEVYRYYKLTDKTAPQVINPCPVAFMVIEVVCETNEQSALLDSK